MNVSKCHICKSKPLIIKHSYGTEERKKFKYKLECPLCRDKKGRKNGTKFYTSKTLAVKHWNDMVELYKGEEKLEQIWPLWLKKKHNRYK